jgi:hypothetical protein
MFKFEVEEVRLRSIVIDNAASFPTPPDPKEPLYISSQESASIGFGVFAAAQEALVSFQLVGAGWDVSEGFRLYLATFVSSAGGLAGPDYQEHFDTSCVYWAVIRPYGTRELGLPKHL